MDAVTRAVRSQLAHLEKGEHNPHPNVLPLLLHYTVPLPPLQWVVSTTLRYLKTMLSYQLKAVRIEKPTNRKLRG